MSEPYLLPPPPQKKSRTGVVLGAVGGVMALLIVAWLVVMVAKVGADGDFPEARYRLTLSKALLGGEYQLEQDFSGSPQDSFVQHAESALGGRDVRAAVASYRPVDRGGRLNVSGVYGRFKDTADARNTMLKDAADLEGMSVARAPEDFRPSGSDVTITCQVVAKEDLNMRVVKPLCAWNGNTGALIGEIDPAVPSKNARDVDLASLAERTLRMRAELRRPIS
ncbi:hypothetical protein [Streptomyces caniscabiei]|uniref:Secreted protein n=1 Tax=Streptomyces caniscabiei TaxID=2746961 RepID=A0ABU4N7H2_9ACTN|nr:hypothetical protein [Streptomyces caniscabiei]MBE4739799.1 hypothetical protein [Streptomyces caniscabiei]MBE4762705.1 hypothetical protein [Streptomyces caniscabiei]MBE4775956.1 hypothetical protein [Streptomyces caniscabiei]MBE4782521.1 hypothetical protein [Streptomyces caniscabiei]MBE4791824.1 hypothetical protein [Streptomyces caniscabiei]